MNERCKPGQGAPGVVGDRLETNGLEFIGPEGNDPYRPSLRLPYVAT